MSVWDKIRQVRIYRSNDRVTHKVLSYVYRFPGRSWSNVAKHTKITDSFGRVHLRSFEWVTKDLVSERFILFDQKYILKGYEEYQNWEKNIKRTKSIIFIPNNEFILLPANEPVKNGLWLVNSKTGELLRPMTKIEAAIGRFYRKNYDAYIVLPNNKIYEVVDGFEYGAKTLRDYKSKRRFRR